MIEAKLSQLVILAVFFIDVVLCGKVAFGDCGSSYDLLSVEIEGCSLSECYMVMGRSYNVNMTFSTSSKTEFLHQDVRLTVFTVHVAVEVTPAEPCVTLPCPLSSHSQATYSANIFINPDDFVEADGELWWTMTSNGGGTVVCMKTPVEIIG